jgi:hypothetical protein
MDDYLKQLADAMIENNRKTKEENAGSLEDINTKMDYLPNIGNQRFPLTKQLLAQNPNIPQDDIQDYAQNVKNDAEENMMAIGGMSSGMNVLGKVAKPLLPALSNMVRKQIPKVSERFGNLLHKGANILDKPYINEIQEKIGIKDRPNLISEEELIESYKKIPELDELAKEKLKRSADIDVIDYMQELEKKKRQIGGELFDPSSMEKTIPGTK